MVGPGSGSSEYNGADTRVEGEPAGPEPKGDSETEGCLRLGEGVTEVCGMEADPASTEAVYASRVVKTSGTLYDAWPLLAYMWRSCMPMHQPLYVVKVYAMDAMVLEGVFRIDSAMGARELWDCSDVSREGEGSSVALFAVCDPSGLPSI